MTQESVLDMMKAYARDAVDLGKQLGKTLDYSEESIKTVEEILEMYHISQPKGLVPKLLHKGETEEKLIQMSKIWGGYIGEVLRKHIGGEWSVENNTIFLSIEGLQIFPPAKAYNRIKNGAMDSILAYYQVMKQDYLKNK